MRKILDYHAPAAPIDALRISQSSTKARFLAGGSYLSREKTLECTLIDLKNCGLAHISEANGNLRIGAMSTITDLLLHPASSGPGKAFLQALSSTGHAIVRNQITIGGSIAGMLPWFNLAAPLMVLDASLLVLESSGETTISFRSFVANKPREYLKNRLILALNIPLVSDRELCFSRLSLTEVDFAPMFAAASISREGETVKAAYVAVSGCLPGPVMISGASELIGKKLSRSEAETVGQAALHELQGKIISANPNFPPAYLEEVLPVVVADCLYGGAN
ncbi:MAG: FAD binding domain-containing protein [Candidatus Wallbacteria bacterium]|nr:FAD binding domain-containing protein [Candidatus Wallbacteria bacterium]